MMEGIVPREEKDLKFTARINKNRGENKKIIKWNMGEKFCFFDNIAIRAI